MKNTDVSKEPKIPQAQAQIQNLPNLQNDLSREFDSDQKNLLNELEIYKQENSEYKNKLKQYIYTQNDMDKVQDDLDKEHSYFLDAISHKQSLNKIIHNKNEEITELKRIQDLFIDFFINSESLEKISIDILKNQLQFSELKRLSMQKKYLKVITQKPVMQNLIRNYQYCMQYYLDQYRTVSLCLLIDVTSSMEKYKTQAILSIIKTSQLVQKDCNMLINWATICYQDFYELMKLKNYQNLDFDSSNINSAHQIQKYLENVHFSGGDDDAEDIKGAIFQMLRLKWPSQLKIAVLICDAPTHGKIYSQGVRDNYPQEDIKQVILELIKFKIFLLGFNLNSSTILMYTEIKKIYDDEQKQDLFMLADLSNIKINDLAEHLSQWIGKAVQNFVQTNNSETKSKISKHNVKNDALVDIQKMKNYFNFEKQLNTKTIEGVFNVCKVEIEQTHFETNITNIFHIQPSHHFVTSNQEKWQCIMTKNLVNYGRARNVFLMKKQNQLNELYIMKAQSSGEPYQTKHQAIAECSLHLICQKLMMQFQDHLNYEITEKGLENEFRYPKVQYAEILLLEESPTKYWIAERLLQGELVKYNNNFGYIKSETTVLNKLAQAFSIFTFVISDTNYMINDIQGVGADFTDPVVNTRQGDYDDKDQGVEGIQRYLVNYQLKNKSLAIDILTILNFNEEN